MVAGAEWLTGSVGGFLSNLLAASPAAIKQQFETLDGLSIRGLERLMVR